MLMLGTKCISHVNRSIFKINRTGGCNNIKFRTELCKGSNLYEIFQDQIYQDKTKICIKTRLQTAIISNIRKYTQVRRAQWARWVLWHTNYAKVIARTNATHILNQARCGIFPVNFPDVEFVCEKHLETMPIHDNFQIILYNMRTIIVLVRG